MIEKIREQIKESFFYDARVRTLECNHFFDEVKFVFEDDNNEVIYHFEECYKIEMEHFVEYQKDIPYRNLTNSQIPYFIQNVEVNEVVINQKDFIEFKIEMYPMKLLILCKKFHIG